MTTRTLPKHRKYVGPNGISWVFEHGTRCLRAQRIRPNHQGAPWGVVDHFTDKAIAGITEAKRNHAIFAAIDRLDLENPDVPLKSVEEARAYLHTVSFAHPSARDFQHVTEGGEVIGWTFTEGHYAARRFYFISCDKQTTQAVMSLRSEAEGMLTATVRDMRRKQAREAAALAVTEPDEIITAEIVEAELTARGHLPNDADNDDVKAALAVLAGPNSGQQPLRLALVTNDHDEADPRTFDTNEARGALVMPVKGAPGMIRIYALSAGRLNRGARDLSSKGQKLEEATWKVEKKIYADRFRECGWIVEKTMPLSATVWNPATIGYLAEVHAAPRTARRQVP